MKNVTATQLSNVKRETEKKKLLFTSFYLTRNVPMNFSIFHINYVNALRLFIAAAVITVDAGCCIVALWLKERKKKKTSHIHSTN